MQTREVTDFEWLHKNKYCAFPLKYKKYQILKTKISYEQVSLIFTKESNEFPN